MQVIKPPQQNYGGLINNIIVFLAGSIEMGAAENWQDNLVSNFTHTDTVFLNPRRDDWDSSWVQSMDNPQFNEQVTWELHGLEMADLVVFVFDPNTKSPITLLELGLVAGLQKPAVVYCPEPFWRKGNVDIVSNRYRIDRVDSFEELIDYITEYSS